MYGRTERGGEACREEPGEAGERKGEVSIIALVTPRDLSFSIGGY